MSLDMRYFPRYPFESPFPLLPPPAPPSTPVTTRRHHSIPRQTDREEEEGVDVGGGIVSPSPDFSLGHVDVTDLVERRKNPIS